MKILHVIISVDPRDGGPVEGLKQLATANKAKGHIVHVASLDSPSDPWVADCPIPCFPMGPHYGKYGYSARLVPWLQQHHHEYDMVIVNGIWQYQSFATWRALRRGNTPYFVFTHGMLDPYFKRQFPFKHLKKWLYWVLAEHKALHRADAILFTCEEERRLARESFTPYNVRELVVNYGVAQPPPNEKVQAQAFSERFPDLQNKRILLSLGRIHPKKGLELALRAFGTAIKNDRNAGQDLHLVLAGPEEPHYGNVLRSLALELKLDAHVSFIGMVSGDLKWGAFRCAEAFILPSYQENFGIAVVEALACGVPVLISDRVNIWREIEGDGAGIVRPATLEGTSELVQLWLDLDPIAKAAMGRAASASFQSRFNAESAAQSLINAYGRSQRLPTDLF